MDTAHYVLEEEHKRYWQNFTLEVAYPLYSVLTRWVVNRHKEFRPDIFFAVSRDGYNLARILKNSRHLDAHSVKYLYVSRKFIKSVLAVMDDDFEAFVKVQNEFDPRFEGTRNVTKLKKQSLRTKMYNLFSQYKDYAQRYRVYLEELGLRRYERLLFFEIGWSGSTMLYFRELLRRFFNREYNFRFLYLGLRSTAPRFIAENAEAFAFMFNKPACVKKVLMSYIMPIEFLFSAPHGRFVGLDLDLNPVFEVCDNYTCSVQKVISDSLVQAFQSSYHDDTKYTLPETRGSCNSLGNLGLVPFVRFFRRKTFNDMRMFARIKLEIGSSEKLYSFVPVFTVEKFNKMPLKDIVMRMHKAPWPYSIFIKGIEESTYYNLLQNRRVYHYLFKEWKPTIKDVLLKLRPYKVISIIKQKIAHSI